MRACPHCKTPYNTAIEFCGIDGARLVESAADPLIGVVIDRYRVTERIGGGGMAAVYRAVHTVIDRQVALKVLFGELASDKAFSERFRHEAQAASRIKHDNVVEVLDFGTTPEGASFLLMELLEGKTLGAVIHEAPGGRLEPKRAAWLTREIAAGLSAAHALGFVHRDLKPANIMVIDDVRSSGRERAKILDFGLVSSRKDDARDAIDGGAAAPLTKTGQTLGTPYYMAPEQIEGALVTGRTDLYALGVIVHEMLSGARPFVGSMSEILMKHASEPPPPLAPAGGLEELAAWLLEKLPSKRPANAAVVVREIEKLNLLPNDAPSLVLPTIPADARTDDPTRTDRAPRVESEGSGSSASALFPASVPSLVASSSARTETALQVPTPSLVHARTPVAARSPQAARGVPLPFVGLVVVVAATVLALGADRVRAILQPVPDAIADVSKDAREHASDAIEVARSIDVVVTAAPKPAPPPPPPQVDAAQIARLDDELAAALARRGLIRDDLARLSAAPFAQRYEEARARTDLAALNESHAALLTEIARAPLSKRVVDAAIARVAEKVEKKPTKQLERRLRALRDAAKRQRSEAERSKLMLDAAALGADAS